MVISVSARKSKGKSASVEVPDQDALVKEESRAEILVAAAEAFMKKGFAATSINTVADILGCTKGRIYYQYNSKADLFFAVHREAMSMNLNAISVIAKSKDSPSMRLRRMIEEQALIVMQKLPFQRVSVQGVELHLSGSTTSEQREVLRSLIDMRDQYERFFVDVVKEGMRSGELRAFDPKLAVKPLLGALNWMTVWYHPVKDETEQTRRKLVEEMASIMIGGLAA